MKASLKPGIKYVHRFVVPRTKTVPALFPEAPEFAAMPEVLATGYLVGLLEWACVMAINPHLDGPAEQSVGILINVTHSAATPPGLEVTTHVELLEVDGKRLVFSVTAHDGIDTISEGQHERFVIDRSRFDAKLRAKSGGASC